ncbi:hypothetical protein VNO78_08377 [Psophocarpus tetragonolobus]|uniref:Transposase, Mutator family n=1 Tax=Psophocarpus tetragonolobus TaxID=3891 RepID=A0AAN9XTP7_PSOTE
MADSTHNAHALKDLEERLSMHTDSRFVELAGSLKQTLTEFMQELLKQMLDEKHRNQHIDCNPRAYRAKVKRGFCVMGLRVLLWLWW